MAVRRVHREAILDVLREIGDWVRGTELVDALPGIHPSSIRLTALHMVDDGEIVRKRMAGSNGLGQAVAYRIKEAK